MNIDTLSIARDLKATELPAAQAEAIAAAIGRSVTESAATKADVDAARASLEQKVAAVDSKLDLKIEALRTEIERARNQLMVSFIGTQVALAGIIIAVIKL
jgi:hypothetical protein